MSQPSQVIFVIDTSALVGRLHYAAHDIQLATTPLLVNEMHRHGLKDVVQMLLDAQKLRIQKPTSESLKAVVEAATSLGDIAYLSKPDQHLLALALDLSKQDYHVIVLTDDYSIQNVAKQLSLNYRPIGEHGIREIIQWETYCPGCKRRFYDYAKGDSCPVCGTPLKRRSIKKRQIRNSQ
ncbi:MAG: NOB1 family endonuclease [Promethearchaeota archaeon]